MGFLGINGQNNKESISDNKNGGKRTLGIFSIIGLIVILLILLLIMSISIIHIPPEHKGVIVSGPGKGEQLDEGWQLINPFSEVKIIKYIDVKCEEQISVLADDEYNLVVKIMVIFDLEEDRVAEIWFENPDYKDTIINNELRSIIRQHVAYSNYTGIWLYTNKTQFENEINEIFTDEIMPDYLDIKEVNILEVQLPYTIQEALDRKLGN